MKATRRIARQDYEVLTGLGPGQQPGSEPPERVGSVWSLRRNPPVLPPRVFSYEGDGHTRLGNRERGVGGLKRNLDVVAAEFTVHDPGESGEEFSNPVWTCKPEVVLAG